MKEFCSEEIPVTPPCGNVKCYALWRIKRYRGKTKTMSTISRTTFRQLSTAPLHAMVIKQHSPNQYCSAGLEP